MADMLAGRVAVVSGIGPGLGIEIARLYAREGADIVLGARRTEVMEPLADEIAGAALFFASDLSLPITAGLKILTRWTSVLDVSRCLSLGPTTYIPPSSTSQLMPFVRSVTSITPLTIRLPSTWFL